MSFADCDLDKIVEKKHPLRKIKKLISFKSMVYRINDCVSDFGRPGYGLEIALKSLFLQFYYDLSDRQLEERIRYDIAIRWFLDLEISSPTPDHSYFGRMRKQIGTRRIGKIFKIINDKARAVGVISGVFSFADASKIKSKETTWKERDKALEEGENNVDNNNIGGYGADPDARYGCKGKDDYWYGYKKHICADMKEGLIIKIALTPANVPDQRGFRHICPEGGMVIADKAYSLKPAQMAMKAKGCHSGAILRNNMKGENKDKDRWLSKVRSPFENIFSKDGIRARYRGRGKNQLQGFLESIVHNVKRLITIDCQPLFYEA